MKLSTLFFAIIMLATVSFASEPANSSTAKAKSAKIAQAQLPTLIFFMNPNGAPCQMQYKILQNGMTDLSKVAKIRYVKTTEPNDQQAFYQYGIRSLPNLILVDSTGKEITRFAPGIQDMETIMKSLHK